MSKKTKVIILGAGCSKAANYPLAFDLASQINEFANLTKETAPRLSALASQTTQIFEQLEAAGNKAATLDDLAWLVHNQKLLQFPTASSKQEAYRLVEEAKCVVNALFLHKEEAAIQTGLTAYRSLVRQTIQSYDTDYRIALRKSEYRVLSFNYDRLFELAFRQHFNVDDTEAFYGPTALNSGLRHAQESVEIDPSRFSLLKLHGGIDFYSYEHNGECRHIHTHPTLQTKFNLKDEHFFIPNDPGYGVHGGKAKPALIVFPHEKDFLKRYPNNLFGYREYIPKVWAAAKEFCSSAKEIQIVGYSCPEPDFPALEQLFQAAKSCERIVIQNPYAEEICQRLAVRLPYISTILKAYPAPFV